MANEHDDTGLVTLNSGAGAGVKGPYTELIASLSFNTIWMFASLARTPTGAPIYNELVQTDIAIGALGSEVIKLPDWGAQLINNGVGGFWGITYSVQFGRAIGERLSVRISDNGPAKEYIYHFMFFKDQLTTTVP